MDFHSEITWHVLIVVFGALIVGSLVGFIMAKRARTDSARDTVANLNARMTSWWIMVLVLFGALALGRLGAVLIFALISFLALREFLTATPTRPADHTALFASFFIVLPYQFYLVYIGWYGMFVIMVPVYAFVLIPALMAIAGDVADFLERTARTQWGLMVCVYFISHIPMLMNLDVPPPRMGKSGLVFFLIAVTQGSDVLQYVWGKLCGKHPIVPKLSPKKTVEGFVGGVLCASALGAGMFRLTPFTPWQAFFVALLLCITGFIGGLVMSAIKRARGFKDWGVLIQGHGGMMDRMDSLCFSAPVFFHVLHYFFVI
jgi:phosphatidate cytidylyltransferase